MQQQQSFFIVKCFVKLGLQRKFNHFKHFYFSSVETKRKSNEKLFCGTNFYVRFGWCLKTNDKTYKQRHMKISLWKQAKMLTQNLWQILEVCEFWPTSFGSIIIWIVKFGRRISWRWPFQLGLNVNGSPSSVIKRQCVVCHLRAISNQHR